MCVPFCTAGAEGPWSAPSGPLLALPESTLGPCHPPSFLGAMCWCVGALRGVLSQSSNGEVGPKTCASCFPYTFSGFSLLALPSWTEFGQARDA